jgi:hypothetical protein
MMSPVDHGLLAIGLERVVSLVRFEVPRPVKPTRTKRSWRSARQRKVLATPTLAQQA